MFHPPPTSPLNRFIRCCTFLLLVIFTHTLQAQEETDFLSLLNDSAGTNSFLLPQRSNRLFPFSENETINRKRLETAEKRQNDKGIIAAASNIGLLRLKQNDPTGAISYFEKARAAATRNNNEKALCAALLELGLASQQLKKSKDAFHYFSQAQPLVEKQNLPRVSGFVYAMLGQASAREKQLQAAIEYYNRAAKTYISVRDIKPAAVCLNAIGELELRIDDYRRAQDNLIGALELLSGAKDKNLEAIIHRNLGLVYFKKGQFESALDYFQHSVKIANQLLVQRLIKDTYMQLFTYYSFKNDFNKADSWHEKYRNLKDSLDFIDKKNPVALSLPENTEEKESVIEMLQKQYQEKSMEMNQKQLEFSQIITRTDIELQSKDSLIQKQETAVTMLQQEKLKQERDLAQKELLIDRQKNFRNLLLGFSFTAFVVMVLLFNRYKIKRNAARRLQTSNNELASTIDRLKQTQEQLVISERLAEEHAQVKQQFLANMSHEIRTPLNAVVGMTNLLLENKPREDQMRYLKAMKQASNNLLGIINDILDLAKIEAGKVSFEYIDFNLHDAVEGVYETLLHKAKEAKLKFSFSISNDTPEWVKGDPTRLSQILINLAGNSLKFTPEGGSVEIRCHAVTDKGKMRLQFEVKDTGIGIGPDELSKIFDSFTQASSDTTRKFGGTGLGLTITKQLVELQGGTIGVSSTKNVGTTFYFALPTEAGEDRSAPVPEHHVFTFDRPMAVLLAEDQPMNQMVAVDTLESLFPGIKVDVANNGQEAVELAAKNTYDIILMDIHMPVMDGFDATREIRKGSGAATPIVALTANVIKEEVDKCLEAGMNAHVGKPFRAEELKNTMANLIQA